MERQIPVYRHVPDNGQAAKIGGYVPDEQAKRCVPGRDFANRQRLVDKFPLTGTGMI